MSKEQPWAYAVSQPKGAEFDYLIFLDYGEADSHVTDADDEEGEVREIIPLFPKATVTEAVFKPVSARASISVPRKQLAEWALWLKGRREVTGQVSLDSIETAIQDLLNAYNDIQEP